MMLGSIYKQKHIYAAVIFLMFGIILWEFSSDWKSTSQILTQGLPNSISLQYSYLLNSPHQQLEDLDYSDFISAELNKAPITFGKLNHWYRLDLNNQASSRAQLELIIDNPMADHLEVFVVGNNKSRKVAQFGDNKSGVPQRLRILPVYSFELLPLEQTTLLIHFKTTSAPFIPITVLTHDKFQKYQSSLHLVWGAFVGVVLLMTVYNMVLYIGVQEPAYLYYICYIGSMLILLGVVHGYGYYIFPENMQLWFSQHVISLNSLAGYFALLFSIHFLKISKDNYLIYKAAIGLSYAIIIYGIAALFIPEYISAKFFTVIQIAAYSVVMRMVFSRIKDRFRWTKYYVYSWIPFFIGAALGYLVVSGYIEYSLLNRHALMFSVIFEMALISMALADRLGEMERERLFQATHDIKLGFANEVLVERAVARPTVSNNITGLSIIAIEISNYDAVIPYIDAKNLPRLMTAISQYFEHQISGELRLLEIEPQKNCALISGEIFAFLVKTANPNNLQRALENISNHDNFNPLQGLVPYQIQCLFGATTFKISRPDPVEFINNAKKAINLANQYKLPFYIFDPDLFQDSDRKIRLAQDLVNAVNNNKLELYHQPQVFLKDTSLRSSEVLLRWNHDEFGDISPSEFIQIAEETGLIKVVTRWVLNRAFSQAAYLLAQGVSQINTSINVSANDVSRSNFHQDVCDLLAKYPISAGLFTLEITETSSLSDSLNFETNIRKLRDAGFKFAIDDFGTGYSSLTYANKHPFSELKIDRSFIQEMDRSKKQLTIVSATLSMSEQLGIHVTAEGVEVKEVLNSLNLLGCDKVQGYLIARPMPLNQYLDWSYVPEENPTEIGETLNIQFPQ